MLNIKILTWSLAPFTSVSFLVCLAYGAVVPEALQMRGFLEIVLPGFRWFTPVGFVVGLIESFLFGAYGGLVFGFIYNRLWEKWGAPATAG